MILLHNYVLINSLLSGSLGMFFLIGIHEILLLKNRIFFALHLVFNIAKLSKF